MKVLFIGNDCEIVYMTGKILKRNKYEVFAAIGKTEALEMLEKNVFDIVILDCDMSEADCNELIQNVKKVPNTPRLLIISGNKEDEIPFLKAGADDWIQKPYKMEVLFARMAASLRQKQN